MAKQQLVCTMCGYVGNYKKKAKGSFAVEVILWLLFLLPGIVYSVWRMSSKQKVCPKCGNTNMIPADTPMGQKLIREMGQSQQ